MCISEIEVLKSKVEGKTLDKKTPPIGKDAIVKSTTGSTAVNVHSVATIHRPLYRSGGMYVNMAGIPINVFVAILVLCRVPDDPATTYEQSIYCIGILLLSWVAAYFTTNSKSTFCILVIPAYFITFLTLPMIVHPFTVAHVAKILLITSVVASMKINICMSVCMHRYASHAAFKCGPITNIAICLLGCLANQGGPLWWSSQHRCHHKFCELPRDPHSPSQVGSERAFGFFLERPGVEEEFVPQHIQFHGLRLLDTWATLVVSLELWLAYTFCGGKVALFIAFTSGWMSQTISLWFNVANHPIEKKSEKDKKSQCTASDGSAVVEPTFFLPFYLLHAVVPLFSWLAMEDQHEHHHNHGNLAKRSSYDVAYWTFIKPLEMMGLIWNVVVK